MKALSIRQPWAWLIAHGYKDVENRTWATPFRGRFLLHASKTFDLDGEAWVRATFPAIPLPARGEIATGGIVGEAVLTDCVEGAHPSPWFNGAVAFVLDQRRALPFAPCKGRLGFFDVPGELAGQR